MKRITLAVLMIWVSFSAEAAQVNLVCPCEVKTTSHTALVLKAGLANIDSTTSGNLRLVAVVHTEESIFDSGFFTLGVYPFSSQLAAGQSFASAEFKTGNASPVSGTYNVTLMLQEQQSGGGWATTDHIRMREPVTLAEDFGRAIDVDSDDRNATLYFDGDPVMTVSGSQATIDLPALVNNASATTTGNLRLEVIQSAGRSIFGSSQIPTPAASAGLGVALAPKSQTSAVQLELAFSEAPNEGFTYYHLQIVDETLDSVLLFQTVRAAETISLRSFELGSIEMLEDDDGDGVSNFNERFAGTDPASASSTPGSSTINLIFYFTAGTAAVSNNDTQARLDQLLQVTNQIYADSGVQVTFNVVHTAEVSLDETQSLASILNLMDNAQAPFDGLPALKTSTGGDIALVFLPLQPGDLCGLANLSGGGAEGDLRSLTTRSAGHGTVYIDCRDNVTAHEIGHIMGLGHSRRESARLNDLLGGTFPWSVGHGSDALFVTVMANSADYGDANELNLFSAPGGTCESVPCGVLRTDPVNGADAVLSLNTVRFQVADFTRTASVDTDNDGTPDDVDDDDDNDGVIDTSDAFPLDATETTDTDSDGIGNNADTDDDGDGVPDTTDAYPLDSTRSVSDARLQNISTRGLVRTGDEVLIGGVIISGTSPKQVVIRARGPSLAAFGVPGVMADPLVQLFDVQGNLIDSNNNWQDHANADQISAALQPTDSLESAISTTLEPGAYTAIVRGFGDTTGVGIVEIFEVDDSGALRLSNISTRGFIGTGDDVLIGGVIISGTAPRTVTFRARGPSLDEFGVPNTLDDPFVQIFDSTGTLIDSNDNWRDHASVGLIREDLKPGNDSEAAITRSLEPGAYTAIVRGTGETTGIGIVEVIEVD